MVVKTFMPGGSFCKETALAAWPFWFCPVLLREVFAQSRWGSDHFATEIREQCMFYTNMKYSSFSMGLPYRTSHSSNLYCPQPLCLPCTNSAVSHVADYTIAAGFQPQQPISSLWLPELAASYLSFLHLTLPLIMEKDTNFATPVCRVKEYSCLEIKARKKISWTHTKNNGSVGWHCLTVAVKH